VLREIRAGTDGSMEQLVRQGRGSAQHKRSGGRPGGVERAMGSRRCAMIVLQQVGERTLAVDLGSPREVSGGVRNSMSGTRKTVVLRTAKLAVFGARAVNRPVANRPSRKTYPLVDSARESESSKRVTLGRPSETRNRWMSERRPLYQLPQLVAPVQPDCSLS